MPWSLRVEIGEGFAILSDIAAEIHVAGRWIEVAGERTCNGVLCPLLCYFCYSSVLPVNECCQMGGHPGLHRLQHSLFSSFAILAWTDVALPIVTRWLHFSQNVTLSSSWLQTNWISALADLLYAIMVEDAIAICLHSSSSSSESSEVSSSSANASSVSGVSTCSFFRLLSSAKGGLLLGDLAINV